MSHAESSVLRPEKELKGFGRVELEPAGETTLQIEVRDDDLRFYDPGKRDWQLEDCAYSIRVGSSSRDLPLQATWRRNRGSWEPA